MALAATDLLLLLGLRGRRRLLGRFRRSTTFLIFALAMTLTTFVFGCGSGEPKTPLGTYTITVNASGGSGATAVNKTVSLQVIVTK
jgi:hypothetical protein